ncbi:hypothetical protein EDB86DRAFT_2817057 [Lactarius hatsudake]|nr:hypothetical protein EDB86DRAFT_2817057 [Lactarius hatsudake]
MRSCCDLVTTALKPIKLVYKISGDTGRLSVLNNVVDWDSAITCVCNKIKTVRKRAVCLEVKNAREDDIPPPVDTALMPQINAFKQLENTLRCEAHRGHCYVDRSGGRDNHQRLTLGKMTEWAKEVVSCYFMRKSTWYSQSVVNGQDVNLPSSPQPPV